MLGQGAYTEGISRRLSAAAFARTDWWVVFRAVLTRLWRQMKAAVRRHLRWLLPAEAVEQTTGTTEPQPPMVVLGEDYAVWVRRRIKMSARSVPVYGFHQEAVVHASDRAIRHMRRRRLVVVGAVVITSWQVIVGFLSVGWALLVLLITLWGVHLVERYLAQLRVNALLAGELRAPEQAEQAHALPYFYERRRNGDRHRFVGAGLQAWPEAVIGIDVEPAPESQDDEDAGPGPLPSSDSPSHKPDRPDMAEIAQAV